MMPSIHRSVNTTQEIFMSTFPLFAHIAAVGIGATALMDGWLWLLSRLGMPGTGFAMVGRWVGHFGRGEFAHASISRAAPIRFELGLGWMTHYLIGIGYALLLVGLQGAAWLEQPTLLPALVFGALTVAAPWFVMQPAMGAGVLALKTPTPLKSSLRNLANHTVFGTGLYVAAAALA